MESFFVKVDGSQTKIKLIDLVYVEANGDYCKLFVRNKSASSIPYSSPLVSYNIHKTLFEVDSILPERFFRCHRSFIVNTELVDEIYGSINNGNVIACGKRIPISERNWTALQNYYTFL